MFASQELHIDCVKVLLQRGADVNIPDKVSSQCSEMSVADMCPYVCVTTSKLLGTT